MAPGRPGARGRPLAGGGREVTVAPERLARWLGGFADRHGSPLEVSDASDVVTVRAGDGAVAEVAVPFPPLRAGPVLVDPAGPGHSPTVGAGEAVGPGSADPVDRLVAHALAERRVGVLLARLGGHAAGVFEGTRLVASKVGARHVQGRTAAGGWSQQRFARRREGQARVATTAAADVAARVLLPAATDLDGLVVGGDRRAVAAVLADPRLAGLRDLVTDPFLDVPDPRQRVLEAAPEAFRAVRVRVLEPPGGQGPDQPRPVPDPTQP